MCEVGHFLLFQEEEILLCEHYGAIKEILTEQPSLKLSLVASTVTCPNFAKNNFILFDIIWGQYVKFYAKL